VIEAFKVNTPLAVSPDVTVHSREIIVRVEQRLGIDAVA
jgi:hypothetical protein